MELAIMIVIAVLFVATVILQIIFGDGASNSNSSSARKSGRRNSHRRTGFGTHSGSSRNSRPSSNPFDNHWESSFDWKDKDNDGYDDRDDGFWNEREF